MTGRLPAADPLLVARTTAALPARLRAKLDAAVAAADTWEVAGAVVTLPGGVQVSLSPEGGVLSRPEQVVCGCLLAPGCLHRAAVLSAAPIADPVVESNSIEESGVSLADESTPGSSGVFDVAADGPSGGTAGPAWTVAEIEVAELVRKAAARLLDTGVAGSGAGEQGELLVGIHRARLLGLHRLAAASTRVVTGVRAARRDDAAYSLPTLTADLLEVLEVAHAITAGLDDHLGWRGQARSGYAPVGGLRLTGLCLEPVLSDSGYAGVVVWLTDQEGRIWSVSDVKPGGSERISIAAQAPVALGEAGLSHRRLSRGGMILSGATANADGRLGAGAKVRAVAAAGAEWTSPMLSGRFGALSGPIDPAEPHDGVSSPAVGGGDARAGGTGELRGAGAGLRFLELTICGWRDDVVLAVDPVGNGVRLRSTAPGGSGWAETARNNLRILGAAPGLRLLAVVRAGSEPGTNDRFPDQQADRSGLVDLIAVGGGDLRLPADLGGHADLGIDRLSPAFLEPSGPAPMFPHRPAVPDPLIAMRRRLNRVLSGGRRTLSIPGVPAAVRLEATALRRSQLRTGAERLEALLDSGQPGERDVFGRLIMNDPTALAQAWLAAGVYARTVAEGIASGSSWRSTRPPRSATRVAHLDE